MHDELYEQLASIEDKHWWFLHRRRLVRSLLEKKLNKEGSSALDVGSGTGGNLPFLAEICENVIGLEKSTLAIQLARKKGTGATIVEGDANFIADFFSKESFDLVTIFNVLYHQWVTDETALLKQLHSLTKPGGYLVISEPAFEFLWRAHDESGQGKRRYRLKELELLLKRAGYEVKHSTYFNSFSFLPLLGLTLIQRLFPRNKNQEKGSVGELNVPPEKINRFVTRLFGLERVWIRVLGKMPIGVTALCVARKA